MKVSGLDVHKDTIFCAIYNGKKYSQVNEYLTFSESIRTIGDAMQQNISTRINEEYIFESTMPSEDVASAGTYLRNFQKRRSECFLNLAYMKNNASKYESIIDQHSPIFTAIYDTFQQSGLDIPQTLSDSIPTFY